MHSRHRPAPLSPDNDARPPYKSQGTPLHHHTKRPHPPLHRSNWLHMECSPKSNNPAPMALVHTSATNWHFARNAFGREYTY
jgi:hypothetical protein